MRKNVLISKVVISVLLMIICSSRIYAAGNFYEGEDRYRGFYWFEDRRNVLQNIDSFHFRYPTPEEAQTGVEARKKEMDDARAQMIELAFREDTPPEILRQAIVKYKKLEAQMHEVALRLVNASEEANMTNPEIEDLINFPTNVFANKIKRKIEEEERTQAIKLFAEKFDLLLFTNSDCPYSSAFIPVIRDFASRYGFVFETTSLQSKEGKLAVNLGIKATPTLIAISKDGKQLFELSRGLLSESELEANFITAANLTLENKGRINIKQERGR